MVALLLGITTWNFAATQGAVQKDEHRTVHDQLDKKLDKIQDGIEKIQDLILELHIEKDKES